MTIEIEYIDYADNGMVFDGWNWFVSTPADCLEFGLGYETAEDALVAAYQWLAKNVYNN